MDSSTMDLETLMATNHGEMTHQQHSETSGKAEAIGFQHGVLVQITDPTYKLIMFVCMQYNSVVKNLIEIKF